MRHFVTPETRAVSVPGSQQTVDQTASFRNTEVRVFSKAENIDKDSIEERDIQENSESNSEKDDEMEISHEIGDIIGTFPKYPETYTLNRLFDQIVDNYSSYPIFGYLSNKNNQNNATGTIQNIATQLLSTNNDKPGNDDQNNSEDDNFEWLTYGEFGELVKATASSLITLGEISNQIGVDGEFIGILLENSIYYPLAQWACAYIGAVIVPIDISFPPEIIISMIQVFKCTSLICSTNTFKNILTKIFPGHPHGKVEKIFLFCDDYDLSQLESENQNKIIENNNEKTLEDIISDQIGIKFYSLPQLLISEVQAQNQKKDISNNKNLPKKENRTEEEEISDVEIDDDTNYITNNDVLAMRGEIYPDTLCALNVGTGKSGLLKPCYLTHYNLIAAASGVESCGYKFGRDIYMSNLPMYRDFERSLQLAVIAHGGCVGFFDNNNQLIESFYEETESQKNEVDDIKKDFKIYSKSDIPEENEDEEKRKKYSNILFKAINLLKPTILVLTGDILKDISDILIQKILKQNIFKRMFFDFTFKLAEQARDSCSPIPWISRLLAVDEYRKYVGGRIRLIISTSCYLKPQIQHNLRTILQIPVIQMYGVTEAGGVCCIQHIEDKAVGNVGAPTTSCEIRLRNFYIANTNVKNGDQGEIMVRGPCLFKCYHKNEEVTNKYLIDGWFATGDLGKILDNGTVEVIDTIMDFNKRRKEAFGKGYRY